MGAQLSRRLIVTAGAIAGAIALSAVVAPLRNNAHTARTSSTLRSSFVNPASDAAMLQKKSYREPRICSAHMPCRSTV